MSVKIPEVPSEFKSIEDIVSWIRRKYVTSVVCLASIVGIETHQFITMLGYFDVDDIILNFVGCLIGKSMYDLIQYIKIRALL